MRLFAWQKHGLAEVFGWRLSVVFGDDREISPLPGNISSSSGMLMVNFALAYRMLIFWESLRDSSLSLAVNTGRA